MKLAYALAITLGVGAIAGIATASSIGTWYAGLVKPSFNPPNALFGPVWTVLYILIGISLHRISREPASATRSLALRFFYIQLFLNFCWSFIFFLFHQIGWALVEIILLWISIIATLFFFSKLNKIASWLLVPYICWVSFAAVLNAAIFKLNS